MTHPRPHVVDELLIILPVVMVLISIPLILGQVPPNRWYGVRTPKTMSSPALWYKANRMGGICLVVSTVTAVMIWGGVLLVPMAEGARPLICLVILMVCQGVGITILLGRLSRL